MGNVFCINFGAPAPVGCVSVGAFRVNAESDFPSVLNTISLLVGGEGAEEEEEDKVEEAHRTRASCRAPASVI